MLAADQEDIAPDLVDLVAVPAVVNKEAVLEIL